MIRPAAPFGADATAIAIGSGVELSVTDRGEGVPLVLLHGVSDRKSTRLNSSH